MSAESAHYHDHAGHNHVPGPGVVHSHFAHADSSRKLGVSLGLASLIMMAEVVGGIESGSLALLSDAAHMITDVGALGLAWWAQTQAARPATERRSYGFHRAGIMAAMVNAVVLVLVSIFISWEAVNRLRTGERQIAAPLMLGVALLALVVNLGIARLLGGGGGHNLNVRGALLHVLGDAAASAGVIVGALLIMWNRRWYAVDPILSMLIALIIVWGAWQILVETHEVLMEGTPSEIDPGEVEESIRKIEGVQDVHHVHIWALSPGMNALSCHVLMADQALSEAQTILDEIHAKLRLQYNVEHATIQFEHRSCGMFCALSPPDGQPTASTNH